MNSTVNANRRIRKSVIAELNWDVGINAGQIAVEVLDDVVTLSGQVASYAEKWDAERAVQRVSRANPRTVDVEDDQTESDPPCHADLARSADGVLKWMTGLPMNSVKVVLKDGSVTLSGELDRDNPRQPIDHTEVPLPTIQLDTDATPTSAAKLEAPAPRRAAQSNWPPPPWRRRPTSASTTRPAAADLCSRL
ncbi:MAG: BON domain-containing protein [Rhodoferax sp.]|nr:BON domain-containing protein [Rhodoferax sp.]